MTRNDSRLGAPTPPSALAVSVARCLPALSALLPTRPLNATALAPALALRVRLPAATRRVQRLALASLLDGLTQRPLPARSPLAWRANAIVTVAARSSVKRKVVPTGGALARRLPLRLAALTAVGALPTRKVAGLADTADSTGGVCATADPTSTTPVRAGALRPTASVATIDAAYLPGAA
jgi:hypothetical protein